MLKSKSPKADVSQVLSALVNNGRWVLGYRNNLWKRRIQVDAAVQALMECADYTDLAADFGIGLGSFSWANGTGWADLLHPYSARSITATEFNLDGSSDPVIDFGDGLGIWTWLSGNGFSARIHTLPARHVTAADFDAEGRSDLAVDFGAPYGIWSWSVDKGWTGQLHPASALHIVSLDLNGDKRADLAIDFGPGYGIWNWINGVGYTARIHPYTTRHLASGRLLGDSLMQGRWPVTTVLRLALWLMFAIAARPLSAEAPATPGGISGNPQAGAASSTAPRVTMFSDDPGFGVIGKRAIIHHTGPYSLPFGCLRAPAADGFIAPALTLIPATSVRISGSGRRLAMLAAPPVRSRRGSVPGWRAGSGPIAARRSEGGRGGSA